MRPTAVVQESGDARSSVPTWQHFKVWWVRNELPRKLLHGSIGFLTIGLYWHGVQLSDVLPVLVVMAIPISTLEMMRYGSPTINRMYIATVGPLMRQDEKEKKHINSLIWYLLGLIFVFMLFPKDIGFLSVLLLSWADLAASTIGRSFGHLTPKVRGSKSMAGSLAALVTGFVSTIIMYKWLIPAKPEYNPPSMIMYSEHLSSLPLVIYALVVGLAASVSELFPFIDDNLSIPVFSSIAAWLVVRATTLHYDHGILAG